MEISGDPVAATMAMRNSQALSEVGYAVLDMQMDAMTMEGQNIAAALEATVNPDVGGNIDLRV